MQSLQSTSQAAVHKWHHKTSLGDRISMCVFFFGGVFLLWYELRNVAAFNHSEWSAAYTIHFLLGIFFAVNIYGNWWMTLTTDVTGKGVVFPSGPTPPGWKYCDFCVANRPPRSHHCPVCKVCVLKRDHHCWFAGTCIGHANHRYFFVMCIHMVVVGIYCNIYNWSYVWDIQGNFTFLTLFSFLLPHVTGLLGYETWQTFFISVVSMIGVSLTILCIWLLQIQTAQLLNSQTKYERKHRIKKYDQGFWSNVEGILGHRKFLVLLSPWLESTLPGDGINFFSQAQKAN